MPTTSKCGRTALPCCRNCFRSFPRWPIFRKLLRLRRESGILTAVEPGECASVGAPTRIFCAANMSGRTSVKYVYFFGANKAEGDGSMKEILGGKGAGLAEMTRIGLPVPAGFTISTECCDYYLKHHHKHPARLRPEVEKNLSRLESVAGKKFGDPDDPLLVSVRSGSARSM